MNPTATHLDYCTFCPKMCRHTCPVAEATGHETYIPQAKMARLSHIRRGTMPLTVETTEPMWACTGCAACANACDHGVAVGPTLFAGRAEAQRRDAAPAALAHFADRFRAREDRLHRTRRQALPAARFSEEARVGLFPGCDAVDKHGDDVTAQLELLDRVGAEHVRLVDAHPVCGGYPLLAAGLTTAFRWHAERTAQALGRFATVVVGCSACVFTMRRLYPAEGVRLPVDILHTSEYLAQHVERIRAQAERPTVWYHDPCHLARHEPVLEAPRRLLAKVAEVREFVWNRGESECCGGGGLLPKTMPSVADAMARRRLAEVSRTGGGTVITSCGTCRVLLGRNAPAGVVVRDLGEYLAARTRGAG
jgi:Fe-S oxidoreductase